MIHAVWTFDLIGIYNMSEIRLFSRFYSHDIHMDISAEFRENPKTCTYMAYFSISKIWILMLFTCISNQYQIEICKRSSIWIYTVISSYVCKMRVLCFYDYTVYMILSDLSVPMGPTGPNILNPYIYAVWWSTKCRCVFLSFFPCH